LHIGVNVCVCIYTHVFGFVESQPDAKKMATSNDRKLMLFFVKIACCALIILVHLYLLILWHSCSWLSIWHQSRLIAFV